MRSTLRIFLVAFLTVLVGTAAGGSAPGTDSATLPDSPGAATAPRTALADSSHQDGDGVHWPSFRGRNARGVADGYATPVEWDEDDILWKTPLPGLGHSSPVVWGDRIFLTTAISERDNSVETGMLGGSITPVDDPSIHTWIVYCLDKATGEILWERTAHQGVPEVPRHPKSTHANPSVATDGEHVVALFGSEGLYVYDMDGELQWSEDLGTLDAGFFMVPDAQWGYSSSPVIHDGMIILQADVLTDPFLTALEIEDGSEIWRTARDDVPTFSTPTVHETGDGPVLVVNGFRHIGGYDARTGEELWRLEGRGDIPTPTPVVAHGLAFITSAHGPGSPIYAVRLSARGDVTLGEDESANEGVAWSRQREGAYMPTPIVYGDQLYVIRDTGVLGVYDARSGEELYRTRLGEGGYFTASPVAGDGKVYFAGEDGDVFVVKAGPDFELLATNRLNEPILASPALSEGVLLFRTQHHVLAVGPE